jgi:starch synthase
MDVFSLTGQVEGIESVQFHGEKSSSESFVMTEEQDNPDRTPPQRPAAPAAAPSVAKPAAANVSPPKPSPLVAAPGKPPSSASADTPAPQHKGLVEINIPAEAVAKLPTPSPAVAPPAKPSAPAKPTEARPAPKPAVQSIKPTEPAQQVKPAPEPKPIFAPPTAAPTSAKTAAAPVSKPAPVAQPQPQSSSAATKKSEPMKPLPAPVQPKTPAPPVSNDSTAAATSAFGKIKEDELVRDLPQMPKPEVAPEQPEEEAPQPPPPRPYIKPMYVVMITPELAPVAKVGGLGDVTYGLARELEIRGNSVEIILPKYDCMRYNHIWGLTRAYENLYVPWFGGGINCTVWFGFVHGRKCFFIEPHSNDNFFNRGVFYGHSDDLMRFAFFNRAAMEFMLKTGKHPDVIHCHDWQTGLVPVLLYEMYQHLGMRHSRVCFTIHNFRHQGVTGPQVLHATGLNRPDYFFHYDRLRDNHNAQAINLMKGGIVYSNFVTTVSPRHAWEAKDGGQGFGLEPTLHTHHYKYGGVLNGLDYEMFNAETDPHIPSHFNAKTIEKKYENKRALRQRLWLADNEKPIISFIGRLDPQKGPELVRHAIFYALNNGAQFVLLGNSPEKGINDHFWGLKHHLNDSPDCHLEIGYNEELAHLIYAGSDMMIVPSRYEPCGLTQLISMRYGTVPIVRSVGGLADTVFDKDFSNRPLHERNGYIFHQADNPAIESAISRAISCYYKFPSDFRHLMTHGMNYDYSWNNPGQHYLNIYDYIRNK